MPFEKNEMTTDEIGKLLKKKYPGNNDDCVNYFWIMIMKKDCKDFDQSELQAVEESLIKSEELKNWAKLIDTVQCGKHTMYFVEGKNGRKERDRELALNKEIRKPVKDGEKGEKLSIIIMRACSYLFEEHPME